MSELNRFVQQGQDAAISSGLQQFTNLPDWLASIKDPDRVSQVLSRHIPEIANGSVILKKCKIGHMLLRDGVWQNRCSLKVRLPHETGEQTLEFYGALVPPGSLSTSQTVVEGTFGAEGWHATFPELNLELRTLEPETELESVPLLTDPEQSRQFLERSLRGASSAYLNAVIQSCKPEVVRYKPGNRCTILYHLEYAPTMLIDSHGPPIVVAKTDRQDKGQNAYEGMKALWDTSFGSNSTVRIAEPLAYDADLRVFVQGPVREEQTLADLFMSVLHAETPGLAGTLNEAMQKTAKGLAELHRSGVQIGNVSTWEDEMAEVQTQVTQLSAVFPNLSSGASPFLERIRQLEAAAPPDPLVPSHGTFRPVQVLLYKDEISFIDFDSFCQSEPARDIGMFLSSLMTLGLTLSSHDEDMPSGQTIANPQHWEARFEQVSSICEQFLTSYQQFHTVSPQRVALWQALNLFYYVLSGWMKVKADEISFLVKLLDRFLSASQLIDAK
ncbi:MAG TPA: phosphotransferase [Anaerolineales bacterium]|nr:phosphotransferase [Anaerolineales bacterium]